MGSTLGPWRLSYRFVIIDFMYAFIYTIIVKAVMINDPECSTYGNKIRSVTERSVLARTTIDSLHSCAHQSWTA